MLAIATGFAAAAAGVGSMGMSSQLSSVVRPATLPSYSFEGPKIVAIPGTGAAGARVTYDLVEGKVTIGTPGTATAFVGKDYPGLANALAFLYEEHAAKKLPAVKDAIDAMVKKPWYVEYLKSELIFGDGIGLMAMLYKPTQLVSKYYYVDLELARSPVASEITSVYDASKAPPRNQTAYQAAVGFALFMPFLIAAAAYLRSSSASAPAADAVGE
jgi:hypothetical protein